MGTGPAECEWRAGALELVEDVYISSARFIPRTGAADSIDVRQRCDTAAPPFVSWNAWIGLVIGAGRCMTVIPLCEACLILGRSWQTLPRF